MTASELQEHAGYLGDPVKLRAYQQALEAVSPGRVVLDLGAGTGLLGLLAAKAGARSVYSVDSGPILGVASDVATASGLAAAVVHIRGKSTEISLPELAEVAVCDQIGGLVYDAGVLEYFSDARRRLLATTAVLVPARFRLFLAPATSDVVRQQIELWRSSPAGLDFSAFAEAAVNTEHHISGEEAETLSAGVCVGDIAADDTSAVKAQGTAIVNQSGRCDGLVGWFEADMGGGASLTNCPGAPDRMRRWVNFYPIDVGLLLEVGDKVDVSIDIRPSAYVVTWKVTVSKASGDHVTTQRHSTLLGQFLDAKELHAQFSEPVETTERGAQLAEGLALANGQLSVAQIAEQVQAKFPAETQSDEADRTLRALLQRFTRPRG